MLEKVREHLDEVVSIADMLPEKYQQKGFEVILSGLIQGSAGSTEENMNSNPSNSLMKAQFPNVLVQKEVAREEIERIFHFDGVAYNIIVGDLKISSTAQRQIRLALLLGIKNLLETGTEAVVGRTELIEICKKYSAYGAANFSTHMKSHRQFFLEKSGGWTLTVPGQQKAAELIKELAQ